MNDLAQALAQHEPLSVYGSEMEDTPTFDCAYCTPRQLLVFPLRGWDAFAEHLADTVETWAAS